MKFFSVALVSALFCAVAVSAAPSSSPFISELALMEESTFGITDTVTKIMNSLIEKTKCTLDVIEETIGDDELKNVFKKYRSDVETIVRVNVTDCIFTNGLVAKLKCTVAITTKLNSLYFKFIGQVLKTNKDLATKITKALFQCAMKPAPFIFNEEFSTFDSEMTFGLTDIIGKMYDALIQKTKCTLDAIEDIVGEGQLRKVYKQLRKEIETILQNDVKQCAGTSGLIGKAKCFLTLQQKINSLFAKFINEVMKTNTAVAGNVTKALFQCLKASKPEEPTTTTQKPEEPATEKPEEPKTPTEEFVISSFDSDMTFGLIGNVYDALITKAKCALDAIEDVVGEGELRHVYQKLRTDVEVILEHDVKECVQTNGLIGKARCFLTLQQKINTLFAKFINEVMKTNTAVAGNVTKALFQCVTASKPEESTTTTQKPEESY